MIEIAGGGFQSVGNVPNGVTVGKLTEHHADQLAPCIIALAVLVCSGLADHFPDFLTRQPGDCLCEKCYICHGK